MSDGPRNPKLGDLAWEVEWCAKLPDDGFGGADMDRAEYQKRLFRAEQFANTFARIVYPHDKLGAVMITPVRLEDPHDETEHAGLKSEFRWEPCGDSQEYSGEPS